MIEIIKSNPCYFIGLLMVAAYILIVDFDVLRFFISKKERKGGL